MKYRIEFIVVFALIALLQGCGADQSGDAPASGGMQRSASAPGAAVFIISPTDGETVSSPLNVKFGISGITVAPAGDLGDNTGHHHLIVDMELADMAGPIPSGDQHLHFGKGQTEATIELTPGQHTLQLVMGDGMHIPHDPPLVSKTVVITVE